ncbi:hypothetical protein [Alloactinosynnema sp. L-07]|uniref:hypothetical protein n=1 Tax=Alloactinosynnema sp. L-07 TaxID=1653480 RepID=UPI00065EF475|nr:hypothetical protein [Alloactinosynnema sp. L-07]CRK60648.1 hypothetical protein [Alloactinosynnema sp. L-07]
MGVLFSGGCATGTEQARDEATGLARSRAKALPDKVNGMLSAPAAPSGDVELLAYLESELPTSPDFALFGKESDGGRVRLRVAIAAQGVGSGVAGGQVFERVRVCVEVTGTRGVNPRAEVHDTACDDQAIPGQGGIPTVPLD